MNDPKFAAALTKTDNSEEIVDVEPNLNGKLAAEEETVGVALRSLGVQEVGATFVKDLAKVGLHVKAVGAVNTQRGTLLLNQRRLDLVSNILLEKLHDVVDGDNKNKLNELDKLARTIGYVAGKITDSNKVAMMMEGGIFRHVSRGGESGKPIQMQTSVTAFTPGTDVVPVSEPQPKQLNQIPDATE